MGAKPPVQKLEMANHRPLRNARDASMPANAHMTARTAVPTQTRPKPPNKIVTKRHMLSAQERWSRSEMMLTPVVVMPETPSNMASRNVL